MPASLSRISTLLLAIPLSLAAHHPQGHVATGVWLERQSYLMGTALLLRFEAPTREIGLAASESAFAAVRAWEERLSTWREDSELMVLNRARAGVTVPLSPELFAVLARADTWVSRTGGAFDPSVGPLIDAWDLRAAGRRPDEAALAEALAATGMRRFRLDREPRTATKDADRAWIDSGAFGKGVALAAARAVLMHAGAPNGFLNFGGQVEAWGRDPAGREWRVNLAAPGRRDSASGHRVPLPASGASAATSGASERWIEVDGRRLGHILDPRSGRPSPAWGSVTVVAADPLVADILSTALYVMGPDEAISWAELHSDLGVTVVDLDARRDAAPGTGVTAFILRAPAGTPAKSDS